jgi:Gas vesicle protein G
VFLIDSILLAPLKGVVWMGQKLNDMAQEEIWDEGRIKDELMRLQLQFELDEISAEEYDRKEEELLDRLDAIANAREKEIEDDRY